MFELACRHTDKLDLVGLYTYGKKCDATMLHTLHDIWPHKHRCCSCYASLSVLSSRAGEAVNKLARIYPAHCSKPFRAKPLLTLVLSFTWYLGYYKPISQWSKGEYPDATQFQDDIQVCMCCNVVPNLLMQHHAKYPLSALLW